MSDTLTSAEIQDLLPDAISLGGQICALVDNKLPWNSIQALAGQFLALVATIDTVNEQVSVPPPPSLVRLKEALVTCLREIIAMRCMQTEMARNQN